MLGCWRTVGGFLNLPAKATLDWDRLSSLGGLGKQMLVGAGPHKGLLN